MKPAIGVAMLLAIAMWPELSVRAEGENLLKARLAALPTPAAYGAGVGAVTAVLTGTKLSIVGTFEGLPSPVTAGRLHKGAKGIRGPAVADLKVSGETSGTITGVIELSPLELQDLNSGSYYVQLHTDKVPSGHLWGWLLPREGKEAK